MKCKILGLFFKGVREREKKRREKKRGRRLEKDKGDEQ